MNNLPNWSDKEKDSTDLVSKMVNKMYQEANAPLDINQLKSGDFEKAIPAAMAPSLPASMSGLAPGSMPVPMPELSSAQTEKPPEQRLVAPKNAMVESTKSNLPTTVDEIAQLIQKISPTFGDYRVVTDQKDPLSPHHNKLPRLPPKEHEIKEIFDVKTIRQDFPILRQLVNNKPLIWLDNAATTQKPQVVIDAVTNFYTRFNSNIHRGAHTLAKKATDAYEKTRKLAATFVGASSEEEIVFFRGATEAINFLANTVGKKYLTAGDEILVSRLEHHSNILPWQAISKKTGAILKVIPIDRNGDILLDQYESLLSHKTKIVAITHVANSIGTVLPVQLMTQMAHRYGAIVCVDGAQSAPHFEVNVRSLNCDFYSVSGHKIYAPTGIGFLYGKKHLLETLPPWQEGGGMIEEVSFEHVKYAKSPYKFEAGTGHIAGVAGLGAAIEYLMKLGLSNIANYEHSLVQYATKKLSAIPGVVLIGNPAQRASVVPFVFKYADMTNVGNYLDQHGIALRVGQHCAQPTMRFFNITSLIRPSFSFYNTREEVDVLARAIETISS